MEKEENLKQDNKTTEPSGDNDKFEKQEEGISQKNDNKDSEIKQSSPEEKIKELEDKLARTFAEMENQRRRFEKEKDDAFEYGGF